MKEIQNGRDGPHDTYNPDEGVPIPKDDGDDGLDLFSRISRAALVVAAAAFSPLGVVLAVIGSWLFSQRNQE